MLVTSLTFGTTQGPSLPPGGFELIAPTSHHHFHLNILKLELIVDHAEQLESAPIRHVGTADFDTRTFTCQFRMCLSHLAIEQKRNISVEPFLQRVELRIRTIPGMQLIHNEHDFVRFRVMCDYIDHTGLIPWLIFGLQLNVGRSTLGIERSSRMARTLVFALFGLACLNCASGQFTPAFLQNGSYWGDGRSEFDLYAAEFMRDGQSHPCELLIIFIPKLLDPASFRELEDSKSPSALTAIQMNQVGTVPRGLVVEQRSISATWRTDSASLARMSFAGMDGFGNIIKGIFQNRDEQAMAWTYSCDTYRAKVQQQPIPAPSKTALFYDELPLRVRMLDFSKANGDSEIDLAPSLASPRADTGEFKTAKISWKSGERTIDVNLRHAGGADHFVLDRDFPFLLREWQMADGSRLKMKNSLKVDYRNYLKNGDRERALKDPMLRHPD